MPALTLPVYQSLFKVKKSKSACCGLLTRPPATKKRIMSIAKKGHRLGQYVRIGKDFFNSSSVVKGLTVEVDMVARVISPPEFDQQRFVVVAFPHDEESVCPDLIGFIGMTEINKMIPVELDEVATVADFIYHITGAPTHEA